MPPLPNWMMFEPHCEQQARVRMEAAPRHGGCIFGYLIKVVFLMTCFKAFWKTTSQILSETFLKPLSDVSLSEFFD